MTHGAVLHIITKNTQHQLGVATRNKNWEGYIVWGKAVVEEFRPVR